MKENQVEEILEFMKSLPRPDNYGSQEIKKSKTIPLSSIKLEKDEWLCVDNIACVFVDLEDSTGLAIASSQTNLRLFAWYGDSLIRIFKEFEAKYQDFQGDGGFAIFDFDGGKGLANAFIVALIINRFFNHKHGKRFGRHRVRIGIDIGKVWVKKVGIRGENKEVWLGHPVSVASKLCKYDEVENIRISEDFYKKMSPSARKLFQPLKNFYCLRIESLAWVFTKLCL